MSVTSIVEWFEETNWLVILGLGLVLNVGANLASVVLWRGVVGNWGERRLEARDYVLTASSTLTNAAVVLPAWWLWKAGYIRIASPSLVVGILETVYLLVALDIAMYVAHRTFHYGILYRWFHGWHHYQDEPTSVLLFVMNPFEAFGFGAAMIIAMVLIPVSIPAVSVFVGWNLLFGTFAHIPTKHLGAGLRRIRPLVWISVAHQAHHEHPMANFGFFSPVWDRLAGTSAPSHVPCADTRT